MKKNKFTLVVVCSNRLHHLKLSLPNFVELEGVEVVVVDFNCKQGTSKWVEESYKFKCRLIKVDDDQAFNISKARNLGASVADTDFLIFADADLIVDPKVIEPLTQLMEKKSFVTIQPTQGAASLAGFMCVSRDVFCEVGGYDENFEFWGWEDTELYIRLAESGLKRRRVSSNYFKSLEHSDGERNLLRVNDDAADKYFSRSIGAAYTQAKTDLRKLRGNYSTHEELGHLMSVIKLACVKAYDSGLDVSLIAIDVSAPKAYLSTHLTYVVRVRR